MFKSCNIRQISAFTLFFLLILPALTFAEEEIKFTPEQIAGNVYMIKAGGGNIGLSIGIDGTFLIDDQFADVNKYILEAIESIGGGEVKFLVNTHYHGDHTGGNELMGQAGSVIFAHENVRKRLSMEQVLDYTNTRKPPMAKEGLPVVTFTRDIKFYFNDDGIEVFHLGPAHTDGDAVVYFKNDNVLHAGDLFFESIYPFVDMQNGGNALGLLEAIDELLSKTNKDTKFIPGHGEATDYAGLQSYRKMIATVIARVKKMADEGKTLEEIQAAKPTAEYDEKYDNNFTPAANFIGFIFDSLKK